MKSAMDAGEEADWLLKMHGGGAAALPPCLRIVTDQFNVIQSRSQLLLTLSTLTFTITGFSGPQIARTSLLARNAIIVGLVFVLLSTVVILLGGLGVRWMTQISGADAKATLTNVLHYRNQKTRLYVVELLLLVIGLLSYVSSVIMYLLSL